MIAGVSASNFAKAMRSMSKSSIIIEDRIWLPQYTRAGF
jgi:hypothetical protein